MEKRNGLLSKRRIFFILAVAALCALPAGMALADGLPPVPLQYVSHDEASITLSFVPLPGDYQYRLYRLPYLFPRREVKVRPYIDLFVESGSATASFIDVPIRLDGMTEARTCYFLVAQSADGVNQSDYFLAQANALCFERPQAAFSIVESSYCASMPLTFQNQSSGLAVSYSWDVGDGTLYQESSVVHTYAAPGTYAPTMTLAGPLGSFVAQKAITVHPLPVPAIQGNPQACVETVLATESGKEEYQWYKDDAPITGATQEKLSVAAEGVYEVEYSAHGCLGASAPFSFSLYPLPNADFTVQSPVRVGSPLLIENDSIGEGLGYQWDFGDGAQSTGAAPSHVYHAPGTYPLTLALTDTCGRTDTYRLDLSVEPGAYSLSPTLGTCMGGTILTLAGSGFPENPVIRLGGQDCQVINASTEQIIAVTPPHPGGISYDDLEVLTATGTQTHLIPQAFRYGTLGFIALPDENAVETFDDELLKPFEWHDSSLTIKHYVPLTMQQPQAILSSGRYLYIGALGAVVRFDTGSGAPADQLLLDAQDQVTALGLAPGALGDYLFVAIHNPNKTAKGFLYILDAGTLEFLATASFDGGIDGQGLDFALANGKMYLLARGPVSQDDQNQHKKAMILNIYDPSQAFDVTGATPILPLLASKNKGPSTLSDHAVAQLALSPDRERLYYPDPAAQSVIEFTTQTDSFKGPDISLSGRPGALMITDGAPDPYLWIGATPPPSIQVFALPPNGAKPGITATDLALAGCQGPIRFAAGPSEIYLTCHDSSLLLTLDAQTVSPTRSMVLPDGTHPTHAQVQNCQEAGQ